MKGEPGTADVEGWFCYASYELCVERMLEEIFTADRDG
jgi:hypothetical protein